MLAKTLSSAMLIAMSVVSQNSTATLRDLTVAPEHLPSGCVLSPEPFVRLDGNTIRSGLWAGLPANPWIGTDPVRIASIRERISAPRLPDGPPLAPRETARFRLHLADGIEEAYEAVYLPGESNGLIIVFALRFPSDEAAIDLLKRRRASTNSSTRVFAIGPIVAFVSGGSGACFQAVATHLESLEN
jgi:hypothetical protein